MEGDELLGKEIQNSRADKACNTCNKVSPRVYDPDWICLDRKCPDFWKVRIFLPTHFAHLELTP